MELAGRLALDAGQIKRFKGFVVWHHLVPVSEGGDDSPENLRPFIHSSHVLIHSILATYDPTQASRQYAVEMMTGTKYSFRGDFAEDVLTAMDAAAARVRAEQSLVQKDLSGRVQDLLLATGVHPYNYIDQTHRGHPTPGLPRCTDCFGQHRTLADRPKAQ